MENTPTSLKSAVELAQASAAPSINAEKAPRPFEELRKLITAASTSEELAALEKELAASLQPEKDRIRSKRDAINQLRAPVGRLSEARDAVRSKLAVVRDAKTAVEGFAAAFTKKTMDCLLEGGRNCGNSLLALQTNFPLEAMASKYLEEIPVIESQLASELERIETELLDYAAKNSLTDLLPADLRAINPRTTQ